MSIDAFGRVIIGSGHFVEKTQDLILAANKFSEIVTKTNSMMTSRPEVQIASRIEAVVQRRMGDIIRSSNVESSAWERFSSNERLQNSWETMKDLALGAGCAAAGDTQGAVEYGVSAAEKFLEGIGKDFGFFGGWGDGGAVGYWHGGMRE